MLLALALSLSSLTIDPALLAEAHRPLIRQPGPDSSTPSGYTPQQLRHAYGLDQIANGGEGQTIGIVDAYDYPQADNDLGVFSAAFGLPACTVASGCLTVVYAEGSEPKSDKGWSSETALDLEWAHAMAPNAKLVLVESSEGSTFALLRAVPIAVAHGAGVVSMSWGTNNEFASEAQFDPMFFADQTVSYFNASGDSGNNLFGYPGASTLVVGVGGTTTKLDTAGNILSQSAWSGSGGGESLYIAKPAYQESAQNSTQRGVPDVAWDADPSTGVPVYDTQTGAWAKYGGTSIASPQFAALVTIANSLRAEAGEIRLGTAVLNAIYASPYTFLDVITGSNGKCGAVCTSGVGYDFVTGLGTPTAQSLVPMLVAAPGWQPSAHVDIEGRITHYSP